MSSQATAVTAWIAFAISVATFVWKFVETYIRWPRIAVAMRQSVIINVPSMGSGETGSTEHKLHVVVVNTGAEAASIANVGVRNADGSANVQVAWLREQGKDVGGPDLPTRIEAHGALEWTISYHQLEAIRQGQTMIGHAQRFQKVRRWPWPKSWRGPLRIYESPNTIVKR